MLRHLSGTRNGYRQMLAKTEGPESVAQLADYSVVALRETAKGVINAAAIAAAPNVVALMWGAVDLVASLGGTPSRRPGRAYSHVPGIRRNRKLGWQGHPCPE